MPLLGSVQMVARVIAAFAFQHLKAAVTFRDHVASIEQSHAGQPFGPFFEDIRSYGSACIMSAAASLEALINELFIDPYGPLRKQLEDFETDFWGPRGIERKRPLEKYQIALRMLGYPKLEQDAQPYRDAWALIELRNALVHFKPTWDPERQRNVDLTDVLRNKYELSPFPDTGADFVTMRSMSAGCMSWVTQTVFAFVQEFHGRARFAEKKIGQFLDLAST
jgi:hypothetical protein